MCFPRVFSSPSRRKDQGAKFFVDSTWFSARPDQVLYCILILMFMVLSFNLLINTIEKPSESNVSPWLGYPFLFTSFKMLTRNYYKGLFKKQNQLSLVWNFLSVLMTSTQLYNEIMPITLVPFINNNNSGWTLPAFNIPRSSLFLRRYVCEIFFLLFPTSVIITSSASKRAGSLVIHLPTPLSLLTFWIFFLLALTLTTQWKSTRVFFYKSPTVLTFTLTPFTRM